MKPEYVELPPYMKIASHIMEPIKRKGK